MSAGTLTVRLARPRYSEGLMFGFLVALAAAIAAYALASGHTVVAAVMCVLPLVGWFATRPIALLALLGLSIPALMSLTGNGLGSVGNNGYNASVSDFLLLLIGPGIVLKAMSARPEPG